MSKRDDYVAKMKKQIDTMNAEIDKMEAKAEQAKGDARARYAQEMGKLRQQAKAAQAKVDELKSAGEDQWDKLIGEAEKLGDAFKHSYNYFKSQL